MSRFPFTLPILLAAVSGSLAHAVLLSQTTARDSSKTCVEFGSVNPLLRGEPFQHPLPRDLEFRMLPFSDERISQWYLTVSPRVDRERRDFMWVVSPPWRTAPHRQLGAGYGLTARESMQLSPRSLRYVLTLEDYAAATAVYDAVNRNEREGASESLNSLGKGTLDLTITGFDIRKRPDGSDTEILEWMTFKVAACVPRN